MPEKNIEEILSEIKMDFNNNQTEIDRLTKENTALKTKIDELAKKVASIKQVSDPYKLLLQDIDNEKKETAVIAKRKKAVVNDEIKDENVKKKIASKIEEVKNSINDLIQNEEELNKKVDDIKKDITSTAEDVEEKKKEYDSLKKYQKDVEGDLKELKDLKAGLQKEENTVILYFLLDELKNLEDKKYDSSKEMESKLYKAQGDLDTVKAQLSDKENELKTAQMELEGKRKEKDAKTRSRKTDIIKLLSEI